MIIRRVLAAFDETFTAASHTVSVSASVGVALARGDDTSPTALIADADAAMYKAEARSPSPTYVDERLVEATSGSDRSRAPAT